MSTAAKKSLSTEAQQVLDRARALPRAEQLRVAEQFYSMQQFDRAEGLDPSWDDELDRRLAKLASGTAVLHDWDDVEAELTAIAED